MYSYFSYQKEVANKRRRIKYEDQKIQQKANVKQKNRCQPGQQ
jgi:hypothetical protein